MIDQATYLAKLNDLKTRLWRQEVPKGERITSLFVPGKGSFDVDSTVFGQVPRAVYFPQHPELTEYRCLSVPLTYQDALWQGRGLGFVVGFSGYATGGKSKYDYIEELHAVDIIFQKLKHRIGMVVHGGTLEGICAVAGLLAHRYGFLQMGFTPLKGLDWLLDPPTDYLVCCSEKTGAWGEETRYLGSAPDILFLFGGGPDALKEAEAALDSGTSVVGIDFPKYPGKTAVRKLGDRCAETLTDLSSLGAFLDTF